MTAVGRWAARSPSRRWRGQPGERSARQVLERPGAGIGRRSGSGWRGCDRESGAAMVEFTFLAVLLLVPLSYIVVAAFTVQKAAFAVTAATREAGRAFVTSGTSGDAEARARAAAELAMRDQGLTLPAAGLRIHCSAECLTPGATVSVDLDYAVALPLVPRALGGRPLAAIRVHGHHTEVVDRFRSVP